MKIKFVSAPIKWQLAMIRINRHKKSTFQGVIELIKPRLHRMFNMDSNRYEYSISFYAVFKIIHIEF